MKIKVDLFVNKDMQMASAFVRQVGDNPPTINTAWNGYDCYTFTVDVMHKTEYLEIKAKKEE